MRKGSALARSASLYGSLREQRRKKKEERRMVGGTAAVFDRRMKPLR